MPKKIVVFADGTGNAFTVQESNVWRLYEALDQSRPDQIAHYIKGVGTSGFKPFAVLDLATGIGVPSNVRKLYEFICWNWRPRDEIYMFGFSRGSFTIRTLIGLMHHEGLIPAQIGDEAVTHAEMRRNVMGAWRSYRSKTIPWWKTFPTVWLARSVRNVVLGVIHLAGRLLLGRRLYFEIARETSTQRRCRVPIKFAGLFDTVEAFGVPIEEFRSAIDWAIWPISFRNSTLSESVTRACHALSLDDERTAFHPLRIDRKTAKDRARIKEVWFAGVHSDVGGGYPEDDLALVPLNWMAEEIGDDLRFIDGARKLLAEKASPYASTHDSRSGLSVFYRYGPRTVGDNGGPPLIHYSVAEKIAFGVDRYAPVTLPDTADVLMPDGTTHKIRGFDQTRWLAPPGGPDAPAGPQMALALKAVESLKDPDAAIVSLTLDNIWRRRVAYFSLLFTALVIAALPWTVKPAVEYFRQTMQAAATRLGWASWWDALWNWASTSDQGNSALVGSFFQLMGSVLPGYAKPWSKALIERPTACGIFIVLAIVLYLWNGTLRDRIADLARQAWLPAEKTAATMKKKEKARTADSIPSSLATKIRRSRFAALVECVVSRYALPLAAIALIYAAVGVSISRSTVTLRDGSGAICAEDEGAGARTDPVTLHPGQTLTRDGFEASRLCWASGVKMQEGQHYALWIEMTDPPFFDQTIMTDIAGFKDVSWRHVLAWPIRRWWSADWFQPVARIGRTGIDTWALVSTDGDMALSAGTDIAGGQFPKNFFNDDDYRQRLNELGGGRPDDDPSRLASNQKIPAAELAKATEIRNKHKLRKIYASNFTAHSDGELILYLNDAIAAIPFGETITRFYENNTGKAKITITRQLTNSPR